ncbi:MAG: bifunctional phosphoglucose/phosphomannose isomerase [Anaerolineae bacterium]|nr:bifunctional phosphoglucose/phosphomannose isomerase [Anaerolineae bacterium]
MNLDDRQHLEAIDQSGMLAHVDGLPEQLEKAFQHGLRLPLSDTLNNVQQVLICGMGGSAIGGDFLGALMQAKGRLPVFVCRTYDLPAWANNEKTLVIASSFSGYTEEVIAAYEIAVRRGLPVVALTTGGELAALVEGKPDQTLWKFDHQSPPRAALGWSVGLLLALAHRLNWMPDIEKDVRTAVAVMQKYRAIYGFEVPTERNPAKRQAGQFMGRFPVSYGGGAFEIVARRWKTQFNENSKIWAMYEAIPEADHNGVVGIEFPERQIAHTVAMFIRSREFDHPRVALRHDLTSQIFLQAGVNIDHFWAEGDTLLAQVMHATLYGDYMSLYAAIAHDADPTVIWPIDQLKEQLSSHN